MYCKFYRGLGSYKFLNELQEGLWQHILNDQEFPERMIAEKDEAMPRIRGHIMHRGSSKNPNFQEQKSKRVFALRFSYKNLYFCYIEPIKNYFLIEKPRI
jgi:hypothetical protein